MAESSVAVAIPTFERRERLLALLRDLGEQTAVPRCVVVVDGSTSPDGAAAAVDDSRIRDRTEAILLRSPHANLPFQRYVGWMQAATRDVDVLLNLDDDIRLPGEDTLAHVASHFDEHAGLVGLTAPLANVDDAGRPVLRAAPSRRFKAESRPAPGAMSPVGHKRAPERGEGDASLVGWLSGGFMACRMAAVTDELFSPRVFAVYEKGWGRGEDSAFSGRLAARGDLAYCWGLMIEHRDGGVPLAYPSKPFRNGFVTTYSRRLVSDELRAPARPGARDRVVLARSTAATCAVLARGALGRRQPASRVWGAIGGALAAAVVSPARIEARMGIDWRRDASSALVTSGPGLR